MYFKKLGSTENGKEKNNPTSFVTRARKKATVEKSAIATDTTNQSRRLNCTTGYRSKRNL